MTQLSIACIYRQSDGR